MNPRFLKPHRIASGIAVCGVFVVVHGAPLQAGEAASSGPISKVARVINPDLSRLEAQIALAERRLDSLEEISDRPPLSPAALPEDLRERALMEAELRELRARMRAMATTSEINAIWGSAILLGLTVLIPAFLIGHRRNGADCRLEQLRQRIAADLHDDIGSNLGSISMIARSARKDLGKAIASAEIARDLDEVETIARESSLAMRDIVWLLESKADSVGDLVLRMREMGGRLLRDVDHTIECRSSRSATRLSMDAKRHLFLFFKEAVHNVRKHAAASRVEVVLADEADLLVLEIRDYGVGLPGGVLARPDGLGKLRERAAVLGARFDVDSAPGAGTRIRLAIRPNLLDSFTGP